MTMTWYDLDEMPYAELLSRLERRPPRPTTCIEDEAAQAYGFRRLVREGPDDVLEYRMQAVPGMRPAELMFAAGPAMTIVVRPTLSLWLVQTCDNRNGEVLHDRAHTELQEAIDDASKTGVLLSPQSRTANAYTPDSVPDKYLEGLKGKERKARIDEIVRRSKDADKSDDPDAVYREFETDYTSKGERRKTKESKHTAKFKKIYGEQAGGSVEKVAKATKLPKELLKQVYDRGLAAWRTGHRPGATGVQWGLARMYSFVTGGKTWHTADADLAEQAKELGFKPGGKASGRKRRKNEAAALAASDFPPGYLHELERYVTESKSAIGMWTLEHHIDEGFTGYCHLPDRLLIVRSLPAGMFAVRFELLDDTAGETLADEVYEVSWTAEQVKDAKRYRKALKKFLEEHSPAEAMKKGRRRPRRAKVSALRDSLA